ncbi:MAG TPA: AAA family ATPase [Mycobacteriales bacterium]|jgi:DNA-binding CsgD family transcriptional regulator|nr:AAA family ATPase [Mycobacteriales bacterium]
MSRTVLPWQAAAGRLVGRSAELSALRARVDRLRTEGTGGLVVVSGEPGVGKSRLVREAAGLAEQAGVTVLTGRAVPNGEPYRPLVEALGAALRERGLPDDDALRPYLPVLAAVLPDAAVAGGRTDPRGGAVLGEAILRLLAALAAGRSGHGTLLVLEDLHWVDPDTLTVLTYLTHAAESAPLLLVATAREERGLPQSLLELVAATQATELPLGRLDAGDVREVVEACLSGRPPEEVVAFVRENADGLPLLVEELLTGLGSVGALSPAGRLVGPLTPAVPRTFAATVQRRVEHLDPAAQSVVRAAAVLGRRFDWSLLPEVTGLSEVQVLAGLRAAVQSGLVEAGDGDTFHFRHALTGDAVRDDLLPPERRSLAHAAAEIVERRDPEAYDLAAGLRAAAGEDERAAELSVAAGRVAARRGALHSADLLLTRAAKLAATPGVKATADRELLSVLANKGDAERALALGERLLREGDTGVRLVLAQVAADAERWDVAAAYLSAIPDAGPDGDPLVGVLAARLAYARGEPVRARQMAQAGLGTARDRKLWSVACQALLVIGRVARLDDAAAARDAFSAAEALAREQDLPLDRVSALHELGTVDLLENGSTDRLERARGLAEDAGLVGLAATLDLQIAAGLLHREPTRALTYAQRCADVARRLRTDRLWATAVCFQAIAYEELGNAEEAEKCSAQSLTLAPDDLDVNAAVWGQVRTHAALVADDQEQLLKVLDTAADYLRRSLAVTPTPTRGLWALVRTLAGKDGDAARAEAQPSTVNWENTALLGYAAAVDCGRRGRRREADAELAAADRAMARLPWWQHRIRLLVADAALTDGWGDPIGWAREALPVFAGRGESRLASRCREVLRKAGAPVPRPGRGDTPVPAALRAVGVTSREVDVLALMGDGLTNTAIAQRLVLSPRTIETHVANLVAKTGVPNRAGLVALARARIKSGSQTG